MLSYHFKKTNSHHQNHKKQQFITQKNNAVLFKPTINNKNIKYSLLRCNKNVNNNFEIKDKNKFQQYQNKVNHNTINDQNNSYAANIHIDQNLINQNFMMIKGKIQVKDVNQQSKWHDQKIKIGQSSTQQFCRPNIVNMKKKIKKIQYQTYLNFPKKDSFVRQKIKFHKRYTKINQQSSFSTYQQTLKQKNITPLSHQNDTIQVQTISKQKQIFLEQKIPHKNTDTFYRSLSNNQQNIVQFYVFKDSEVFPGARYQQLRNRIVPQRMDNDNQTDDQQMQKFIQKVKNDFIDNVNKYHIENCSIREDKMGEKYSGDKCQDQEQNEEQLQDQYFEY